MSLAGERRKEDERLFEEEYTKLKGETERKYALIPKFYSKVSARLTLAYTVYQMVQLVTT